MPTLRGTFNVAKWAAVIAIAIPFFTLSWTAFQQIQQIHTTATTVESLTRQIVVTQYANCLDMRDHARAINAARDRTTATLTDAVIWLKAHRVTGLARQLDKQSDLGTGVEVQTCRTFQPLPLWPAAAGIAAGG